jgi:hypothetical protein
MGDSDYVEMLRRRWDEGKASGRAGPLDIKRFIAEERERLNAGAELRQQVDAGRTRKAAAAKPKGKR